LPWLPSVKEGIGPPSTATISALASTSRSADAVAQPISERDQ
jgi:hypothetical protein